MSPKAWLMGPALLFLLSCQPADRPNSPRESTWPLMGNSISVREPFAQRCEIEGHQLTLSFPRANSSLLNYVFQLAEANPELGRITNEAGWRQLIHCLRPTLSSYIEENHND